MSSGVPVLFAVDTERSLPAHVDLLIALFDFHRGDFAGFYGLPFQVVYVRVFITGDFRF
jgi:hypothetical protein